MKITLVALLAVALSFVGLNASAATYSHKAKVQSILLSEQFGQCAVVLAGFPAPGNCGASILSLDCEGTTLDKSRARAQLELAQMAFALEKEIRFWFTDDVLLNGRCLVIQARLDAD